MVLRRTLWLGKRGGRIVRRREWRLARSLLLGGGRVLRSGAVERG